MIFLTGERMTEEEVKQCFARLLGLNEEEEERLCEYEKYDKNSHKN